MTEVTDKITGAIASLAWKIAEEVEPMTHHKLDAMATHIFQSLGTNYDRNYIWDALQMSNFFAWAKQPLDPKWKPLEVYNILKMSLAAQPTHTTRTDEQIAFQQFSTPLHYSYIASWCANLKEGDIVLEPSAGLGQLTIFPLAMGLTVHVNEYEPRRHALLKKLESFINAMGKGDMLVMPSMDADHMHARMPQLKPDVVIMNPPFSSNGMTGIQDTMIGARHVDRALAMLKPGGRLVAIVSGGIAGRGSGMAFDAPKFKDWWKNVMNRYTVRCNLLITGDEYKKMGTTIQTRLLVIDKVGATVGEPITWTKAGGIGSSLDGVFVFENEIRNTRGEAPAMAAPIKTATGSTNPFLLKALARMQTPVNEPVQITNEPQPEPVPVMKVVHHSEREEAAAVMEKLKAGSVLKIADEEETPPWEIEAQKEEEAYEQEVSAAQEVLAAPTELAHPEQLGGDKADTPVYKFRGLQANLLTAQSIENGQKTISTEAVVQPEPMVSMGLVSVESPVNEALLKNLNYEQTTETTVEVESLSPLPEMGMPTKHGVHPEMDDAGAGTEESPAKLDEDIASVEAEEETDEGIFRGYIPFLRHADGKTHPAPLVESEAMRMVKPPVPKDVKVMLPESAVKGGRISAAQLERVVYAVFASNQWISDEIGFKSFLVGDGTGFGKGTTLAAIAMHFKLMGFKRILWVSKTKDLISDARRDWSWIGGDEKELFLQEGQKKPQIQQDGIMFTSYSLMARRQPAENKVSITAADGSIKEISIKASVDATGRYNDTAGKNKPKFKGVDRYEQILQWEPELILMDEAHEMGNATVIKEGRGTKKASQKAIASIDLMRALPTTKIIFASATAATEVRNLAYAAERMGLCGPHVPAFPDLQTFITKVAGGGMLVMELVAKDMKALGLYQATNLSYNGTTFDILTHPLTDDQKEMYDDACKAWRMVMQALEEGMEVNNAQESGDLNKYIKGQYYGAMQRFFNQLLTSIQTPTAIIDMEKQLEAGNSIVIQLVNTNEAATDRAVASSLAENVSLDDLDITPKDTLMNLVKQVYPIFLYENYLDENGNFRSRPVKDDQGDFVPNPVAIEMRDELLLRISCIRVPQGALDMVLDHFGGDNVAEVTGRSSRYIMREGHRQRESRSKVVCNKEVIEFNEGKRRILLFSGAGNTGRSFHSDKRFKNQQRRVHYVLQPGWRADEALQGLGRTHRTNAANCPHYRLVTTELKGQKRFITSIARRIEQLGSLTKGDRKAASGGLFSAEDNLETNYATGAVWNFFLSLHEGRLKPLGFDEVTMQMGLTNMMDEETGALSREKMPNITKFLNRLLCLECALQDEVFDTWYEMMIALVEEARENGTLDMGMEKLNAQSITKISEIDVHHDKETNAVTSVVELMLKHKVRVCTWEMVNKGQFVTGSKIGFGENAGEFAGWYRNKSSNRVFAYFKAGTTTDHKTGSVVSSFRRVHPRDYMRYSAIALKDMGDLPISEATAKQLWDAEVAGYLEYENETVYMLTGAILPVWEKVAKQDSRVVSATTDTGERMVGLVIKPEDMQETMRKLGAVHEGIYRTHEELFNAVMHQKCNLTLANGYVIRHSKSGNRDLMLLLNVGGNEAVALMKQGLTRQEYLGSRILVHIPYDNLQDYTRFSKILESRPPIEITHNGVPYPLLAEPKADIEKRIREQVKAEECFHVDDMVELVKLPTDHLFEVEAPEPEEVVDLFTQAEAEPEPEPQFTRTLTRIIPTRSGIETKVIERDGVPVEEEAKPVVIETHVVRKGPDLGALSADNSKGQKTLADILREAKEQGKKTNKRHYERELAGQMSMF